MTGISPSLQLAAAICAATCCKGSIPHSHSELLTAGMERKHGKIEGAKVSKLHLDACDFQQKTAQVQQPLKPITQAHKMRHVLQRHNDGLAHRCHDWL